MKCLQLKLCCGSKWYIVFDYLTFVLVPEAAELLSHHVSVASLSSSLMSSKTWSPLAASLLLSFRCSEIIIIIFLTFFVNAKLMKHKLEFNCPTLLGRSYLPLQFLKSQKDCCCLNIYSHNTQDTKNIMEYHYMHFYQSACMCCVM